jgi:menaquinone-dependent protoporphyrinogen IX oxidase
LLSDEEGKLKNKKVALFVVCLRKNYLKVGNREAGGPVYLRKMEDALGKAPVASKIFGGRMIVAEMEEEDRKRTESFSKKQGRSFNDQNIMSEKEIDEFIQDIKAAMDL